MMDISYPAPVDRLLSLGRPGPSRDNGIDYLAVGLGDAHVPALIRVVQDPSFAWEACGKGEDETPYWAPVHAWRALGQLRAGAAVEPLLDVLHRDQDNDWAMTDIPDALGMIGAAALGPVRDALARAAREPEPRAATTLAAALQKIGRQHPDAREGAVAALTVQLQAAPGQDPELNAFLIADLLDLGAGEAAPVMEAAFAAGAVEESVCGDWQEVQMEMGLLPARTTPPPRPRYDHGLEPPGLPELPDHAKPAARPERATPANAAAKASQQRKAQKKASRRKRK